MCKHEEKQCPRCNEYFECRAGSITTCECTQVQLSEAITAFIALHYQDCLCLKCLKELQQSDFAGII